MNIVFSLAYFSLKVQVFLSIFIKKLTICIFSVKFTYFLLLPNFDDKFNSMLKQKKHQKEEYCLKYRLWQQRDWLHLRFTAFVSLITSSQPAYTYDCRLQIKPIFMSFSPRITDT